MQAVCITVTSTALPTIRWRCPSCPHSEFECSQRFRMNSNGKVADIWLIYRCARCSATKNLTVVERTPVRKVQPALFAAATTNDPVVARAMARDVSLIKAAAALVARGDGYDLTPAVVVSPPAVVELHFPEPLLVRLDEVLAGAAGITRACVQRLVGGGRLCLAPAPQRIDKLRIWGSVRAEFR